MTLFEKSLLVLFIITLTVIGIQKHTQVGEQATTQEIKNTPADISYEMAQVLGDHDSNTCWFIDTTVFNEEFKMVYVPRTDDVIGRWDNSNNTISIMFPGGTTTGTVAHEVSHLVDDLMVEYNVDDEHFEAYLQGFLTECFNRILTYDIEHAEPK